MKGVPSRDPNWVTEGMHFLEPAINRLGHLVLNTKKFEPSEKLWRV